MQDLHETHTTHAIESSIENVVVEQSSEKAISIDTIPNDTINDNTDTDTITNTIGQVDCTNNNTNNLNHLSNPAPPLPDCPPPSQITVFAETAMSAVDVNPIEIPQSIPVIETQIQNDSALVGNTKIELDAAPEQVVAAAAAADVVVVDEPKNDGVEKQIENVVVVDENQIKVDAPTEMINESAAVTECPNEIAGEEEIAKLSEQVEQIEINESIDALPKPEDIAETIAILDRVNESDVKASEEIAVTTNTEPIKDDLSADISSPLPQNSLESLPSPQSLSSNVTPPSEIDENTATELANEDISMLPPPPPPVDDQPKVESNDSEACGAVEAAAAAANTNGNNDSDELLPPPPVAVESDAAVVESAELIDELKTNGLNVNHENVNEVVPANGDCHLNGSAKAGEDAANDISDKVITTIFETHVRIH